MQRDCQGEKNAIEIDLCAWVKNIKYILELDVSRLSRSIALQIGNLSTMQSSIATLHLFVIFDTLYERSISLKLKN
ncbi:hypothetical protein Cha6605_4330 [Chamaesiphon minutus PCC 6605]|uniref:Uncharacterized protein n=1 Tax=Chamaesiphon minutus (strain ATCC 27169 / PCC 6605) TaxID=1173020 RepID=K9UM76_CHAP6|nr:hypothetical protein Cha6605_4330 [Chamaesiphon minutus PCC 6605]